MKILLKYLKLFLKGLLHSTLCKNIESFNIININASFTFEGYLLIKVFWFVLSCSIICIFTI